MFRKSLLISMAALGLTMSAHANLWDNRAQSNDRYGKPFRVDDANSLVTYAIPGWLIVEWFDEAGSVQSIVYYKMNGKVFSQKEIDNISLSNDFTSNNWVHISQDVWATGTDQRFERSSEQLNGKTIYRVVLCTHKGYDGMNTAFQNSNNDPSQNQTEANPKIAL